MCAPQATLIGHPPKPTAPILSETIREDFLVVGTGEPSAAEPPTPPDPPEIYEDPLVSTIIQPPSEEPVPAEVSEMSPVGPLVPIFVDRPRAIPAALDTIEPTAEPIVQAVTDPRALVAMDQADGAPLDSGNVGSSSATNSSIGSIDTIVGESPGPHFLQPAPTESSPPTRPAAPPKLETSAGADQGGFVDRFRKYVRPAEALRQFRGKSIAPPVSDASASDPQGANAAPPAASVSPVPTAGGGLRSLPTKVSRTRPPKGPPTPVVPDSAPTGPAPGSNEWLRERLYAPIETDQPYGVAKATEVEKPPAHDTRTVIALAAVLMLAVFCVGYFLTQRPKTIAPPEHYLFESFRIRCARRQRGASARAGVADQPGRQRCRRLRTQRSERKPGAGRPDSVRPSRRTRCPGAGEQRRIGGGVSRSEGGRRRHRHGLPSR